MGYNKPKETDKAFLLNAPLPNHGKSYTVISHQDVINNTQSMLTIAGFKIEKEIYRANADANVAQGIYHLKRSTSDGLINLEDELGMMFAWQNSYDKSTRFQCAVGAHVFVCSNGMISGDMMNFKRKHTGSADFDIKVQITDQIKNAELYFKRMINDKDNMKTVTLDKKKQSEILGRLYVEKEILDVTQLACVKAEIEKPSYNYNCDVDSAWTFYNHVTHALKKSHPRDWLSDSQKFHEFMVADLLTNMGIKTNDTPQPIVEMPDFSQFSTNNQLQLEFEPEVQVELDFEI